MKQEYRITLTTENHSHKPKKIYKWHTCKTLKEAWDFAREFCSEYNKSHKVKGAITGVCRNGNILEKGDN